MRAFFGVVWIRFKRDLQYRSVYFYSMLTQIAFGVIICMTRAAFLRGGDADAPMTMMQVMSYSWIGQATLRIQPWGGDTEVMTMLRSGDVSYELMRPMSLCRYWYARAVALRLVPVALIMVPQIIVAAYLMPRDIALTMPGVAACFSYALSMAGAVLLSAAITTFMSMSLLFTISGDGIARFLPAISIFLSGGAVPLAMFPSWSHIIVNNSPFAGVYDLPARIFIGMLPPNAVLGILGMQLFWTLLILTLCIVMQNAGLKRLRVQGG